MANITFLIGNGFDLNLGLKTSYRDFYGSLVKDSKNAIIREILEEKDYWADMEFSLGQCLDKYSPETVDSFIADFIDIEDHLTSYLKKQNERFAVVDDSKVADSFGKSLQSINTQIAPRYQGLYNRIIHSISEPIMYSFICFNYTSTLDSIVNTLADRPPFSSHSFGNNGKASDRIALPLHIHGKLEELMVVGVNDEKQINNPDLRGNEALVSVLVKPKANDGVGNDNTQAAKTIIGNSRIIYVYGLSMGATDKLWAQSLFEWLRGSAERLLIFNLYDSNYNRNSASRVIKWERDAINRIATVNELDPKIIDEVRSRICCISKPNAFSIKGYGLADERDK